MRISNIAIDSFGHWKGLRIPHLADGVTVIHGPNEAGKSTILQLIRAVLYGFSPERHGRFVPPLYDGRVGGTIHVTAPNGTFQVRRWLLKSGRIADDPLGELSVQSADGSVRGKHLLASLLSGVDERLFQSVFAVGLTEMQRLGTLSDSEVAQQMFGLASGSDRVSIAQVSSQLERARSRLIHNGSSPTSIEQLSHRIDASAGEFRACESSLKQWLTFRDELKQIEAELSRTEERRGEFGELINGARPNQAVREQWRQCQRVQKQLDELGELRDIPVEMLDRLNGIAQQLDKHRKQWEQLRERRRALKEQSRRLERRPSLLQHAEPIETLSRRRASVSSQVEELSHLLSKSEETEFELQAELERLGIKAGWQLEAMPFITEDMVTTLQGPARAAREARREVDTANQEYEKRQAAIEEIQAQVARELDGTNHPDITAALRATREQARLLQARLQTDTRLDKLRRNQKEAKEEAHYWTQRQVLSPKGLAVTGLVFSLGVVIMLMALFHSIFGIAAENRMMMAVIGLAVTAFAVILKNVVAFAATRRADSCRDEVDQMQEEIEQSEQQIRQANLKLPTESEPFGLRLQKKQEEIARLTELEPLELHRLSEQQQAEPALEQKRLAEQRVREARTEWRSKLRVLGLPEGMTPAQFRQMSHREGKLGRLRKTFGELRQEIELRQSETETVQQRVQLLAERVDHVFDSDQLEDQIHELAQVLQQARTQERESESLHRKWSNLGREQEKIARAAKRFTQRRQKIVAKYGVVDTHELKDLIRRRSEATQLQATRDQAVEQISERLGPCCSARDLLKCLNKGGFEKLLSQLESEQQQVVTRQAELYERRGELNEKLKGLAGSRQLTVSRLEQDELESQLRDAIRRWATMAGVSNALEQVRVAYESDQQPETLAEASGYLKQLTDGRYSRIWTPFGESSLSVDSHDGRSANIEGLSRGTREQVFLSLRLALAAAYSRRGARLPVIFDDVLVNFDTGRARAAANTLCEFAAAGHQVLVFTCHDHIRNVFASMDVDVRSLPTPENVISHGIAVLPDDQANRASSQPAPAEATVIASPKPSLPSDYDDELERELIYGAPEYDPGYVPPVFPDDPAVDDAHASGNSNGNHSGSDRPNGNGHAGGGTRATTEIKTPNVPAQEDWAQRYDAELEDR